MERKIVRKQVTFNIRDPKQRELLSYALSLDNFSGRMKKLLKEDYERHLKLQQLELDIKIGSSNLTLK